MNRIKLLYRLNKTNLSIFFVWYVLISVIVFSTPRISSFQWINSMNHQILDYFFSLLTQFGDGIFVMLVAVLFFFLRSRKIGIAIAASYIGSGLICSVLKRSFQAHRPAFFLKEDPSFHSLSWLPLSHHNAFPSGHTTSAFALAFTLMLFSKDKRLAMMAMVLACLTGYSRVYLGQHFLDDVWFGSILGAGFSCLYFLMYSYFGEKKLSRSQLFPPSFKI
ncbi:phosphatase PAP2 family protein [Sphingobacterium sp. CZ-2]|nr:phosphatase PAP2 family protein [Sphingobacterium sp. CZ-2]